MIGDRMNNALLKIVETKEEADLQKELAFCPFLHRKAGEMVTGFLKKQGINSLWEVTGETELVYQEYVRHQFSLSVKQKPYYANALESFVWCCLKEGFPELVAEMDAFGKLPRAIYNKVQHFLVLHRIRHLKEIDYALRMQYQDFLKQSEIAKADEYIKGLDRLKLYSLQQFRSFQKPVLVFAEKPIFLLYHPDYEIAKEFYYRQDKEELVFDFSLQASMTVKRQIFAMLQYSLSLPLSRKNRRELYLVPLQKLYRYSVTNEVNDLEQMDEMQRTGFYTSMKGKVGTKLSTYFQILDNTQKYLFLHAEKTNWEAGVWYLERFHLKGERKNPSDSTEALRFYQLQEENRKLLQEYLKYWFGISNRSVKTILGKYCFLYDFLKCCDRCKKSAVQMTETELLFTIQYLENKGNQDATFNRALSEIAEFYQFLLMKGKIPILPLDLFVYQKKIFSVHHDRFVSDQTQQEMLAALRNFPEHLRLMYLHLWGVGLRSNEVCCLKGDAYSFSGGNAWLRVYQYKMKTYKTVPIPVKLYQLMTRYIQKHQIEADDFVFQNKNGGAYRTGTFSKQMKKLCLANGIQTPFRSHDYRHTVGTKMYEQGASLQAVRDYLGHRSENMTQAYIDFVPRKIDDASEQYFEQTKDLFGKERYGTKGLDKGVGMLPESRSGREKTVENDGEEKF